MYLLENKIQKILKEKDLSIYKVSKLMDFSEGALRKMISSKSPFSRKAKEKIIIFLEVSREEFDSWIVADKYPKEVIELAVQTKREVCHPEFTSGSNNQTRKIPDRVRNDKEDKLILTIKIDGILKEKGLSRTQLSKLIKYDQSSVNRMITGKNSLSQSVIDRIAPILEVSENTIKSWVVADKYKFEILKNAIRNLVIF